MDHLVSFILQRHDSAGFFGVFLIQCVIAIDMVFEVLCLLHLFIAAFEVYFK